MQYQGGNKLMAEIKQKTAKPKKTIAELKQDIIAQKKKAIENANKRLRELEKRERQERLKPYFKVVEKYLDNISDKDLETMTKYVLSKFAKK
jgi:uncharacterized coiled-coil protein SlyX